MNLNPQNTDQGAAPSGAAPSPRHRRDKVALIGVSVLATAALITGTLAFVTSRDNQTAEAQQTEMLEQLDAATTTIAATTEPSASAGDADGVAGADEAASSSSTIIEIETGATTEGTVLSDTVGTITSGTVISDGGNSTEPAAAASSDEESDLVVAVNIGTAGGIPEGTLLGRITIPKIGLDRSVIEGVRKEDIDAGGFAHHPNSPLPGEGGTVLACHRTTHGGPCRDVHLLAAGDTISYTAADGAVTNYKIVDLVTIPAAEVSSKIEGTVANMVTFYTCSDETGAPGSVSHRTLVRAVATTTS